MKRLDGIYKPDYTATVNRAAQLSQLASYGFIMPSIGQYFIKIKRIRFDTGNDTAIIQ